MKKLLTLAVLLSLQLSLAQETPTVSPAEQARLYAEKMQRVTTIDSIVNNLYTVISGEKGQERDWDRFKFLFYPNAQLIPTGTNKAGKHLAKAITLDEYIESSGKWLIENGFYEVEIARKTDRFDHIAQVFSTYETYHSKADIADKNPFMRGINSIQLLNDGERWWIVNIFWAQETEDSPIPEAYIGGNSHDKIPNSNSVSDSDEETLENEGEETQGLGDEDN